ncbi:MAG: methyltransferase type 11, partial [Spirochaetes bacterium GWB1_36_13]
MTASIRNYEKEFNEMIDFLALKNTNQMSFLDLGCGTGASLVYAAKHFQKVYGVDVSKSMLEQAQKKIEKEKITNASLIQSGFLTYTHQEEPVDLVMTKAAFHHLPDFWKQIALLKMNQMLKKNGLLYLFDVVFHLDPKDYQMKINQWVSGFEKLAGKKMKEEVEI